MVPITPDAASGPPVPAPQGTPASCPLVTRRTVRWRLTQLVAACVLPVWLCAGLLVHYAVKTKWALVESHMAESARALALAVDQELAIIQTALEGLTTSPALDHDDFPAFRVQVAKLLRSFPQSDIVMADATGQQVFNSYLPPEAPLPKRGVPAVVRQVFETGRPGQSRLFRGAVTGRAMISLDMPVWKDGRVHYDLAMTVPAARFSGILAQHAHEPHWVITILDPGNTVVARTAGPESLVGQSAEKALPGLFPEAGASVAYTTVNLEHVPVLATFVRAKKSGFGVVVSVPQTLLLAEQRIWLWWTIGGTALLSLLGLGVAMGMARGITRSIQALIPQARALAEGTPVDLSSHNLDETLQVAKALDNASWLLRTRAAEREAAERKRQETEERLKEHDRIFRIVADNSANWEYWVDAAGSCQWVSPSCLRISGYPSEAFLSGRVTFDAIIHPEDRKIWESHLATLDQTSAPHGELNVRILRPDGTVVPIGHVCEAIVAADGSPLGRRGSNRDMTEQLRIEGALKAAKAQADAANQAKSEFLANMSHEIRTPLSGVLGMLQLLAASNLDDEQRDFVQMATGASKRLTRLLSDILDLSQIESGKLSLREAEFAPGEVRQAVLDIFAPMAGKKGLALAFDLDDKLPPGLIGDDARLRQVLLNLVGNAVKYTDTGGIRVTVAPVATDRPDGRLAVCFTVSDTGRGIAAAMREAIFDRFVQVGNAAAKAPGGVGLGLAIVKRLTDLMGGTIALDSALGHGTTIRVTLPFAVAGSRPEAEGVSLALKRPDRVLSILVAEDDAMNQFAIERLLTKVGHRPRLCANGELALAALAEASFDLVLMDVQMPIMDGLTATRHIRSDTSGRFDPAIPVVAMTAYAMSGDREKFLAAGMNDYVAKPMDAPTLLQVIEQVMAARAAACHGNTPS